MAKLSIRTAVFAGIALAIGVVAVGGLALYMRYLILNSGPFSDAQVQARAAVPIENIRVSQAGGLSFLWKVDDRFELACGDDFTIRKGTKISDFPSSWGMRDCTGVVSATYGSNLFDVDNSSGERVPFIFVETDEEQEVVGVIAFCNGRRGLRLIDLQSSKQISLYRVSFEELDAFFRELPQ